MTLCLFEDAAVAHLRPLVETRPVWDLRLALRTIRETAVDALQPDRVVLHSRSSVRSLSSATAPRSAATPPGDDGLLLLNGRFVARDGPVLDRVRRDAAAGTPPTAFRIGDTLAAAWLPPDAQPDGLLDREAVTEDALPVDTVVDLSADAEGSVCLVDGPATLLDLLPGALHRDVSARQGRYNILDDIYSRRNTDVHESVVAIHPENIVLEEGVSIRPGAILNASDGPIVIDRRASIAEQAVVRGPCYVGPRCQIKVGANIHTSAFGTYCKVGGEVHDSILHAFSNKAHAGFLGHSYIGQWCNLGADTNTSNLKNDYGEVRLYDPAAEASAGSGRQFMGLVMGDHSKCGINTMFNTGTVIGTCCNVYGGGFPPRYLPPFSWGSPEQGFTTYRLDKALEVAEHVLGRRDRAFTDAHRQNLTDLFEQTRTEREELLEGG